MEVDIVIKEDEGISYINTPYFRSGNEIYNSSGVDSGANITIPTKNSGHIKLRAGIMKQVELACNGLRTADSFAGQFVVEYDIVRSAQAGVILNLMVLHVETCVFYLDIGRRLLFYNIFLSNKLGPSSETHYIYIGCQLEYGTRK